MGVPKKVLATQTAPLGTHLGMSTGGGAFFVVDISTGDHDSISWAQLQARLCVIQFLTAKLVSH